MINLSPTYPTPEHAQAAETITELFSNNYAIEAVLLVNSCARGKATPDSCLDMVILAQPEILATHSSIWKPQWNEFNENNPIIQRLKEVGEYSVVHLGFSDGIFVPKERDEAGGPDSFELEVGNTLAYSVPLWQESNYLDGLKQLWLPYYNETMRQERLKTVKNYCLNNLHHVPLYIKRGLYFQAFDRLHNASQEFLQLLFMSHQTYPIAYNKWIKEQLVDILNLPELYQKLTHLWQIKQFESDELIDKAKTIESLLEQYTTINDK